MHLSLFMFRYRGAVDSHSMRPLCGTGVPSSRTGMDHVTNRSSVRKLI